MDEGRHCSVSYCSSSASRVTIDSRRHSGSSINASRQILCNALLQVSHKLEEPELLLALDACTIITVRAFTMLVG